MYVPNNVSIIPTIYEVVEKKSKTALGTNHTLRQQTDFGK